MRTLAYLDASSGSMLPQAFARGLPGLAVFAQYYWHSKRQRMRRYSEPEAEQSAARLIDELRTELHELAEAG